MTKVEVLLFAAAVDVANGQDRITVDVPSGATAGDVLKLIGAYSETMNAIAHRSRLAVNQQYVTHETIVDVRHEIALIPPVSGG